jgi:hypothetical protein
MTSVGRAVSWVVSGVGSVAEPFMVGMILFQVRRNVRRVTVLPASGNINPRNVSNVSFGLDISSTEQTIALVYHAGNAPSPNAA